MKNQVYKFDLTSYNQDFIIYRGTLLNYERERDGSNGQMWTEMDHCGLNWIEMDHCGLNWIEMDCSNPKWTVVDQIGPKMLM